MSNIKLKMRVKSVNIEWTRDPCLHFTVRGFHVVARLDESRYSDPKSPRRDGFRGFWLVTCAILQTAFSMARTAAEKPLP